MDWESDRKRLTQEERDELMAAGETIVNDITHLIATASSKITMNAVHDVALIVSGNGTRFLRSAEIVLLFTVTDLGGSARNGLEAFIEKRLLELMAAPHMAKYKIQWHFTVKEENQDGGS